MKIAASLSLLFWLVLGVAAGLAQVAGRTGLTVGTTTSLLAGCTVGDSTNVPTCATPRGWTLVAAQGFGGALGPNQFTSTGNGGNGNCCGITTDNPHGAVGEHALKCSMTGSGQCAFGVNNVNGVEYYISWWEWETPGPLGRSASFGIDHFYGDIQRHGPGGNNQEAKMDTQNSSSNYLNNNKAQLDYFTEGNGISVGCYPDQCVGPASVGMNGQIPSVAKDLSLNPGTWVQYEFDFQGNSCSGSTPNHDGHLSFWEKGTLLFQMLNANITGCPTFNNEPTMGLIAGGYRGFAYFADSSNRCVSFNDPTFATLPEVGNNFSNAPVLQTAGSHVNATCWGSQSPFFDYIDDVIILKK
jgi:hypothetical protein